MIKMKKNRQGFSMLEVVFVIVILGIVASIGAETIAKVYESYIVQRGQHRSSVKTQLALNQIVNRLRYAIPGTLTFDANATRPILQWVGSDGDSFEAIRNNSNRKPGWSGFCDIASSTGTSLSTPGSNFTLTNTIHTNLGGAGGFSIFFPHDTVAHTGTGSGTTITLGAAAPRIVERYKLAWTSYALVVDGGDLFLYYNFTPSIGAALGANRSLLLKDVTTFRFNIRGDTTRIKICATENIGDSTISSCKEKAVF